MKVELNMNFSQIDKEIETGKKSFRNKKTLCSNIKIIIFFFQNNNYNIKLTHMQKNILFIQK